MTPEQTRAAMNLRMMCRLIQRHGLTSEQAVNAVVQHRRGETGEHTHLIATEALTAVSEIAARVRGELATALTAAVKTAAASMAALTRAVETVATRAAGRRPDRPAWVSPYGPPTRRR